LIDFPQRPLRRLLPLGQDMTPDELRLIMVYLKGRVRLEPGQKGAPVTIAFETPDKEEMKAAGLNPQGVDRILSAPWWGEMVSDILETPEFCEADESPQQVLHYARDVVSEYIRKRFPLNRENS
jgi:hypothetical protein